MQPFSQEILKQEVLGGTPDGCAISGRWGWGSSTRGVWHMEEGVWPRVEGLALGWGVQHRGGWGSGLEGGRLHSKVWTDAHMNATRF